MQIYSCFSRYYTFYERTGEQTNGDEQKYAEGQLQPNFEWEMHRNPFRGLNVARPIPQPISTSPKISTKYTGRTQIKQSGVIYSFP